MQTSFSVLEYASKKKVTRRDRFLAKIETIVPWAALVAELESYYPKGGRSPIGLERMLQMYIAQQCFGLSDVGIEDATYGSQAIRRFVGVDLAREAAADATTLTRRREGRGSAADQIPHPSVTITSTAESAAAEGMYPPVSAFTSTTPLINHGQSAWLPGSRQ